MSCPLIASRRGNWIWSIMSSRKLPENSRNRHVIAGEMADVEGPEDGIMSLKPLYLVVTAAAVSVFAPLWMSHAAAGDLDKEIPAAMVDPVNPGSSEVAVLAGGCFWGQQGLFEHVKGVTKV